MKKKIKKKQMKKRIWIVIKLRFFINLEIIEEEDKKKKLYLFFLKIYKYCYNLRHIRPLFFQCNIRLLQFKMHQTFFFNGVIKNKKNQITLCLHCYNLSCIRLFLCKFFLLKSKTKKKKKTKKICNLVPPLSTITASKPNFYYIVYEKNNQLIGVIM